MSRLIVVIREPLRSMLTPAGLKVLELIGRSDPGDVGDLAGFCGSVGIDVAACCESPEECADCRQRREDAAEASNDDRRAGL